MLTFEDYDATDAIGWAERIRVGDITALEVAEAAIARAEAVNGEINAIAVPLFERARDAAKAGLTGPLGGVPWAMKDLYQTIEGVPITNGSRAWVGEVGKEDALLTRRYRAAGLNILCTSTAPELALSATTESTLYGATRNPWDLTRTSGGSSGGASALVAAGVLPAAHATDGGGSIRGPASCCGLFGLKPSRGRVPIAPGRTEGWLGGSTTHCVSRSVRDSALLLDVAHGAEPGSRYVAPGPHGTFAAAAARRPGRLRIAFHDKTRSVNRPDPQCRAALEDAARLCADLGHVVEEVAPEVDFDVTMIAFGVGVLTALAHTVASRREAMGPGAPPPETLFEETTLEYCRFAEAFTARQIVAANDIFMAAALRMAEFQADWDVILTPTMGQPPIPLGTAHLMQPSAGYDAGTGPFSCYTAVYNTTGQPAMTVPLWWSPDGLPVGVQFAGRIGEEELLLSLAAQLEEARPWFSRRPRLAADL